MGQVMGEHTRTATINYVTGMLDVKHDGDDLDIAVIDGEVVQTHDELDPWGAEEYDSERAVVALESMGWHVVPNTWHEATGGDRATVDVTR